MLVNVSADMRRGLVADLINSGAKATTANEIIDLAAHAVDVAIEEVRTICLRGSTDGTVLSAHPLALTMLSAAAEAHAGIAQEAAMKVARETGLEIVTVTKENQT